MIFQGSKKYPGASHFKDELSKEGGSTNAFTSKEETKFYFDTNPDSFYRMLEIFSQLFTGPLLNKESSEKEIHAINSEAMKNINQDNWQQMQLICHLSDKDS